MRRGGQLLACVSAVVAVGLLNASVGTAAGVAPGWAIRSAAAPTSLSTNPAVACPYEGSPCQGFFVTATNVGSASSGAVVIRDTLPAGVSILAVPPKDAQAYVPVYGGQTEEGERVPCTVEAATVTCSYGGLPPGGVIQILIEVSVAEGTGPTVLNRAEVEEPGGTGAFRAATAEPSTTPTPVNAGPAAFGVQDFSMGVFGPGGEPDVQAGAHPGMVMTAIAYNTVLDGFGDTSPYEQVEEPKIENVDLPMGFAGDALAAPRCSETALAAETCPPDTRIGIVGLFKAEGRNDQLLGLYNVTPEHGYPAQFGFNFLKSVFMLRPRVLPTAEGYVLSVPVPAVPRSESEKFHEVTVTIFGDPSTQDGGSAGEAFAANPDGCSRGTLNARFEMNAWLEPGNWQSAETPMFEAGLGQGVIGCNALQFQPSLEAQPETAEADTPSGYEVVVRNPQSPNFEGDLATPDLKDATVSFPEGVSVSPSAANGLAACQASGPEGIELGSNDPLAADNEVHEGEELGADELVHASPGHCPQASQIGDVEAVTPLLTEPLHGHLYVAAPGCGGAGQRQCTPHSAEDGELFGVYLEVSGSGIIVKLNGSVYVNPSTGQLTTRFQDIPEQPVSEVRLKLNGGPRSPLANPQSCGSFTVTSDLTPGSTPFTPDATPFSSFPVTGCTAGAFNPGFLAHSTSSGAGAFSPFTLTVSRKDGEQNLSGLSVAMPVGLLGKIAGFARCGQAEIAAAESNTGGCPAASALGTATAAAGAGSSPFWQSGTVYLTGPYKGAPFGLAVVVPANAGPFHLGNIVVRAAIHVDPVTAAVSVVSDPLPQMVDGVPLRVQTVNVTVGGANNFTFNPTNCAALSVTGTVSGSQGASKNVAAPFAASGCAALPFKPVFTASTAGQATKAHGASLDTKVTFPAAPAGSGQVSLDANIASFKVELPKQLPSRNTTLQKACLAATFEANPAGCPAAADVGSVSASTPLLSAPLTGPAYLVSYGGEKFPQLVMVMQGEGVTIDVTGTIFVSKAGITSVTLKTVPDAPITSFELKTPKGPFSALTSFVPARNEFNLCGQSLAMPTTITAQNGAVIKQATKVSITGCGKAKKKKKKTKARRKAKKAGRAAGSSRGGRS